MGKKHTEKEQVLTGFILYNLIFSEPGHTFTIPGLMDDLKEKYQIDPDREYVQTKVNEYIKAGLIFKRTSCYTCL